MKLTAFKIKSLKQPGRYSDGGGLYLEVEKSGSRHWVLRVVVRGRRRDIGLGSVETVDLASVRMEAARMRAEARSGGDPTTSRQRQQVPTMEEATRKLFERNRQGWKAGPHHERWIAMMERYVFVRIGKRLVSDIERADVLAVLEPIWLERPETARKVRHRIGMVMDWAHASGHRTGENPVRTLTKVLPRQGDTVSHHRALPASDVPALLEKLRAMEPTPSRLALEWAVLTACRSAEVRLAAWSEVDTTARTWTIPAPRTKTGKPLVVPLTDRMLEVLALAGKLDRPGELVFPGQRLRRPLTDVAVNKPLRQLGYSSAATLHGFRSTFRDWAAETTNFANEVVEMALGHAISNKVEAAYRRGDLFEKRRKLMEQWSAFVSHTGAEIVPIGRRA